MRVGAPGIDRALSGARRHGGHRDGPRGGAIPTLANQSP